MKENLYIRPKIYYKTIDNSVLIRYNVKNEKGERIDANTQERDR